MFNFFKKDIPLENELWQEFKGMKNTNDILAQKAEKLAVFITYLSAEGTKLLFKNSELDDSKYYEVFFEVSIFYLHFIDRLAFQYLDITQRDVFMDMLLLETAKIIFKIRTENNADIKHADFGATFDYLYGNRQEEYGKYKKMLPEKDEGMANTLFWEFGKKIANILKPEVDMLLIMSVQEYIITPAIKVLNIPKLLGEN